MYLKQTIAMFALCAATSVFAQSAPPVNAMPSVALPPDLDRVLRDYEKNWSSNNPAGVAALFAADGMALPNGSLPALGAEAIKNVYVPIAGSPMALRALAYSTSGDLAYIIGGFGRGEGKPDIGKFVLVLRKTADGRWMIALDMDNTNAMPRRASPQPAPTAKP